MQKYIVFMDGNQWCATTPEFVNLQESPAGFGDTPSAAIEKLQDTLITTLRAECDALIAKVGAPPMP